MLEASVISLRVRDFAHWRGLARSLLAANQAPHTLHWHDDSSGTPPLFAHDTELLVDASRAERVGTIKLPRRLLSLLETAACYRAADRWALLYQVLWRWTRGDHSVISQADSDGARINEMARAVRREAHDMRAYVRFRDCGDNNNGPQFVAWFEPAHDVLPEVAKHFAERMGRTTWLIVTPQASAAWDGDGLLFGPGLPKPDELADKGEALWLSYYRNTFNPTRLNMELTCSHMPKRFWKNLPEAALIPAMVANAKTGLRRASQSNDVGAKVNAGDGAVIRIHADDAQPKRPTAHALDECRRCDLWRNATHGVPGAGPSTAKIVVVGEQPGDQEDLQGLPFVGPAGKILDRALAQAGVSRDEVYITNAVKHFKWEPRGKRRLHKTPAQQEIEACHYWLQGELEELSAKVVIPLGATALKSVLQTKSVALGKVLGQTLQHDGRQIVPTYHPSYVLRLREELEKDEAIGHIVAALRRAKSLANAK